MSKSQRRKGANFERAIARMLRDLGFDAHRGLQGAGARECDVVVDGSRAWLELKCGARPNIWAAMRQAVGDAPKGRLPIVVAHRDRAETLVCLRLSDVAKALEADDASEPE